MIDPDLEEIAARVDRIADRFRNANDLEGEQRAYQASQVIRSCSVVAKALEIESRFLKDIYSGYDSSSFSLRGEYDDSDLEVDFDFISELEGGQQLNGYVPDVGGSRSGVTIATGVDLGQRSRSDINQLDIPDALKDKLSPYSELKGQAAEDFLRDNPLVLNEEEADSLDKAIKEPALSSVSAKYDNSAAAKNFSQLPPAAQTAIASVSFQYGDLATRTPTFWGHVTNGRWQQAVNELRNFGDRYPTRRGKEADLLQAAIDRGDFG